MVEWLGSGLQNLLRGFDSLSELQTRLIFLVDKPGKCDTIQKLTE